MSEICISWLFALILKPNIRSQPCTKLTWPIYVNYKSLLPFGMQSLSLSLYVCPSELRNCIIARVREAVQTSRSQLETCWSRPHKAPCINPCQKTPTPPLKKATTIPSLSASDWWHRGISFTTAQCFCVTVTTRWKQSKPRVLSFTTSITREKLKVKKKKRSNNWEVIIEVK